MKLSIDILSERLSKYTFEQIYGAASEPTLEGVRLLHRYLTKMDTRYLYLGDPDDIEKMYGETEGATIVCCGVPRFYDHVKDDCNLYIIRNDVDFAEFHNEVEETFTYYNNCSEKLNVLCSAMVNIQDIIDASDEVLPYPISLVECGEYTIAYSKGKTCDDPRWENIQTGCFKTEDLIQESSSVWDVRKCSDPRQLYMTDSKRYILIQPVVVNKNVVAFVLLMKAETDPDLFSRATEQIVKSLTKVISRRMEVDQFYGASMGGATEFFWTDLVGGGVTDREVIVERSNLLNLELQQARRILCVTSKEKEMMGHEIRMVRETIGRMFPHFVSCTHENNAVFIEKRKGKSASFEEKCEAFSSWLERMGMVCGISMEFESLFAAADNYEQAQRALQYGTVLKPDKNIFYYEDYEIMHSLELMEQHMDLRNILHPLVRKMLQIYGENHFMLDTLYTYLLCERNMSNTAKRLYIHRNTLLYRVEQMLDKLECDFTDPALRQKVIYSLEIIRYLKKYKKETILPDSTI